jgi:hypothetical protein
MTFSHELPPDLEALIADIPDGNVGSKPASPNSLDRSDRSGGTDRTAPKHDSTVFIDSFAHGGSQYELQQDQPEIQGDSGNYEHGQRGQRQENPRSSAQHGGWPEPDMRLVDDDCVPAPQLTDDALPAGWGDWVSHEAEARNCPGDYVAGCLIGKASIWIGNSRRLAATADWIEPAHLWIALIGNPSAGKTPPMNSIVAVSKQLERECEPEWQDAISRYERDAEAAKARDKEWRESVREAVSAGRAPPNQPVDARLLIRPPRPRILAMDCSTEELQRMLSEAPRGLAYVRDELAGWLGGFDRYGGNGADRAFFLEAWNGGFYSCDRVRYHGEPIHIDHTSVAILGGIVPDKLRGMLAGTDDGLTARLIYLWPEPLPVGPLTDGGDTEAAGRRSEVLKAARNLRGLPMGADFHGAPTPIALRLDPGARGLFDEIRQDAMGKARNAHGLAAGWHGKNPGRTLRLALDYELLAWARLGGPEPRHVSADSVARAGAFLDHCGDMLDRVTGGLALTRAESDAAKIAHHLLKARPRQLNERDLYQAPGFRWARETSRLTAATAVLDRAGWMRRPPAAAKGRPRGDWQVSPHIVKAPVP